MISPSPSPSLALSLSLSPLTDGGEEEEEVEEEEEKKMERRWRRSSIPHSILGSQQKSNPPLNSCKHPKHNHATTYKSSGLCKRRSAAQAHQQTTTTQDGSTIIQQSLHKGPHSTATSEHQNTTLESKPQHQNYLNAT